MKGQINIEYIVSFAFFIMVIILVINQITDYPAELQHASKNQDIKAESERIIDLLVNEPGYWNAGMSNGTDWENHPSDVERIGLAEKPYILSYDKLLALEALAKANSSQIAELVGLNETRGIKIEVVPLA